MTITMWLGADTLHEVGSDGAGKQPSVIMAKPANTAMQLKTRIHMRPILRDCDPDQALKADAAVQKVNPKIKVGASGQWFVYILRCSDGSLYTGVTTDVQRRSEQHNAGIASRYTRSR